MGDFAYVLRSLRNEKGMTQQGLADLLGVSKSSINMYERGERQPNFETLELIADFFHVNLDFLLGRTEKAAEFIDPEASSLHFNSGEYSEEELKQIRQFAEFLKNKRKS